MARECGSCTKCCEGWLSGTAHEHKFWPGRRCHYVCSTGCEIYENRPVDPCRTYSCAWLTSDEIPGWMKPNEVNVIATIRTHEGIEFLDLAEAGSTLSAEVLSWAVMYALGKNKNLRYMLAGGRNKIGAQDFLDSDI